MDGSTLSGRVAFISGAGGRFGQAIAHGFAEQGAALVVADAESEAWTQAAVRFEAYGERALVLTGDVTDRTDVERLCAAALAARGRIDILVNATGRSHNQDFFDFPEGDFDDCLNIGLKSYFLTCQVIGRHMAERRYGRIINLTSIVGRVGSGEAVGWCATRGGVDAMTRALAQALGYYGITVNALAHGGQVDFPYLSEEAAERIRRIPFGRLGTAADLVGPAVFLASESAGYVTGQVLYADGGYSTAAVTDDRHRPEWARAGR